MSDSTQLIRRKGICKNPDCDMCMSREVQEIEPGEEFICSDCGSPLQDVNDKTQTGGGDGPNRTVLYAIICLVVAIACGVGYWFFVANSDDSDNTSTDPTEVVDDNTETGTNDGGTTTNPGGQQSGTTTTVGQGGQGGQASTASGTVSMQNGTYNGPLKGGKPNGIGGTFTCTRAMTIDLKDGYGNTVDLAAGDKIIDTKFENGLLQQGEIHFSNGTRKYISGLNTQL